MSVSAPWVLGVMIALQPIAPWKDTYPKTAEAIAKQSASSPVFDGTDGDVRTAALLISIARYESNFKIDAAGDCDKVHTDPKTGMCMPGGIPSSFGLYQINVTNLAGLGVTREELLSDPVIATRAALRMIRTSFKICSSKPLQDRLGWYHMGGNGCFDSNSGRIRMKGAFDIFAKHPVTPG